MGLERRACRCHNPKALELGAPSLSPLLFSPARKEAPRRGQLGLLFFIVPAASTGPDRNPSSFLSSTPHAVLGGAEQGWTRQGTACAEAWRRWAARCRLTARACGHGGPEGRVAGRSVTAGDSGRLGDSHGVSRTPQPGAKPWAAPIRTVLGVHCLLKSSQARCEAGALFPSIL